MLELVSSGGLRLRGLRAAPPGAARGELLLVHGLSEHLGRYGHVVEALVGAGYRVTAFELRGHGRSQGVRGHVDHWDEYVADLATAAERIEGPFAVVAHSTGALVALDHLRRKGAARALFLSGPLLAAHGLHAWSRPAVGALARLAPRMRLRGGIDQDTICSDRALLESHLQDPFAFHHVTARWVREMDRATRRVRDHAASFRVPLACHWGSADRIVDVRVLPAFCERWGGPVEARAWPGLCHEIFNEPQGPEVLAAAIDFLGRSFA